LQDLGLSHTSELPPEAIVFTIGIDKQGLSREPHRLPDSLQYLYHALIALERKEAGDSITQYVEWTILEVLHALLQKVSATQSGDVAQLSNQIREDFLRETVRFEFVSKHKPCMLFASSAYKFALLDHAAIQAQDSSSWPLRE
jgi:hypothetical protein